MRLFNDAIDAEWSIAGNSVFLKKVTNKYDGQTVDLENVILFAIELEDGRHLTNLDFKLKSKPSVSRLASSDTVPSKALLFPGTELSALMAAEDKNLEILWKAQLQGRIKLFQAEYSDHNGEQSGENK